MAFLFPAGRGAKNPAAFFVQDKIHNRRSKGYEKAEDM
jgi:hypothetical protein